MTDSPRGKRQGLATPDEVADYYGIPVATLYVWKCRGKGPKVRKIGRHLRYRWPDVFAYEQAHEFGGAA